MPSFVLYCEKCQKTTKRLLTSCKELVNQVCDICNSKLVRQGNGPTASVYEKLDNGAMSRSVERLRDAEELHKERADNSDPRAGKAKARIL
jgi:hypothetical protein